MYEDVKKRYQFSSWSKTPRQGVSMLLRNFVPRREDCLGWKEAAKAQLAVAGNRRLTRTEWAAPRDAESRVLVDVYETPSFADAQKCLLETLANNELLRLPDGPAGLGEISFVHPEGVPPAAFWVVGNLCMSVTSFGSKKTPALDFARRLQARAIEKPHGPKRDLRLKAEATRLKTKEETVLHLTAPRSLPEDVQYKYFATGGELFLKGDQVAVRALKRGAVAIVAYAIKPPRSFHAARRTLKVI
ncbi:MAG: hypothetical protein A2Z31_08010 [candidate division NC10 bacterium RBG_16_65_8]|nr:MAG: hypothetical protein A2Z31_08010 [candidate division NC10 bacterium RBG_16_65_8]